MLQFLRWIPSLPNHGSPVCWIMNWHEMPLRFCLCIYWIDSSNLWQVIFLILIAVNKPICLRCPLRSQTLYWYICCSWISISINKPQCLRVLVQIVTRWIVFWTPINTVYGRNDKFKILTGHGEFLGCSAAKNSGRLICCHTISGQACSNVK